MKKICTKLLVIFNILFIMTNNAVSEESLVCQNSYNEKPFAYIHRNRGKVVVYKTPISYTPTPEDLVCATIKQFWSHKNKFPSKLTIMVVREDFMNAIILQINLSTNTMMIAPVNIPSGSLEESVKTVWTIFPDPMKRLTEMVRLGSFPLIDKNDIRANYAVISRQDLIYLSQGHKEENIKE